MNKYSRQPAFAAVPAAPDPAHFSLSRLLVDATRLEAARTDAVEIAHMLNIAEELAKAVGGQYVPDALSDFIEALKCAETDEVQERAGNAASMFGDFRCDEIRNDGEYR